MEIIFPKNGSTAQGCMAIRQTSRRHLRRLTFSKDYIHCGTPTALIKVHVGTHSCIPHQASAMSAVPSQFGLTDLAGKTQISSVRL